MRLLSKTYFLLQAQSYCLKHMILSVPDLRKVYSEIKLSEVIVMMIDRLPEKQLDESKINTIKDIVHCPLFENSQCREILLPAMASHVRYVGLIPSYMVGYLSGQWLRTLSFLRFLPKIKFKN
jgi:hypothetical protein